MQKANVIGSALNPSLQRPCFYYYRMADFIYTWCLDKENETCLYLRDTAFKPPLQLDVPTLVHRFYAAYAIIIIQQVWGAAKLLFSSLLFPTFIVL